MARHFLERQPSISEKFSNAFARGSEAAIGGTVNLLQGREKEKKQIKFLNQLDPNFDWKGAEPEMRQKAFELIFKGKQDQDLYRSLGLIGDQPSNETSSNNSSYNPQQEPIDNRKPKKFTTPEKAMIADKHPGIARTFEHAEDVAQREKAAKSAETQKMKEEIVARANTARKSIQNKKHLLNVIKTGNVNDPTYAMLMESLPFNLGQRMLSPETAVYKAGLVDEFGDLRNIFQGQTRVKEIEIMEGKLANLYLTDEQKEAILKSRIDALQADIIREEAASEVETEFPGAGMFEFNRKVNEKTEKKLESLFNKILDEQQFILKQAENRKQIPLDPDNPEDGQIIDQLMEEAGGSEDRMIELAKKKGYRF